MEQTRIGINKTGHDTDGHKRPQHAFEQTVQPPVDKKRMQRWLDANTRLKRSILGPGQEADAQFHKPFSSHWEDHFAVKHDSVGEQLKVGAWLFAPRRAILDPFEARNRDSIKLHEHLARITDDCDGFVPGWLNTAEYSFNASIPVCKDGIFEVKATAGDTHSGGESFDDHIIDFCKQDFERENRDKDTMANHRTFRHLRTQQEQTEGKQPSWSWLLHP